MNTNFEQTHTESPWLQKNGQLVALHDSKILSKEWDHKTWERYLISIESGCAEILVANNTYDEICRNITKSIFTEFVTYRCNSLRAEVDLLLLDLTAIEFTVIRLIFWDGRTERAIADTLGLSRSTVRDAKRRGLKRIKAVLKGHTPIFHIMKGPEFATDQKEVSSDRRNRMAKFIEDQAS